MKTEGWMKWLFGICTSEVSWENPGSGLGRKDFQARCDYCGTIVPGSQGKLRRSGGLSENGIASWKCLVMSRSMSINVDQCQSMSMTIIICFHIFPYIFKGTFWWSIPQFRWPRPSMFAGSFRATWRCQCGWRRPHCWRPELVDLDLNIWWLFMILHQQEEEEEQEQQQEQEQEQEQEAVIRIYI